LVYEDSVSYSALMELFLASDRVSAWKHLPYELLREMEQVPDVSGVI